MQMKLIVSYKKLQEDLKAITYFNKHLTSLYEDQKTYKGEKQDCVYEFTLEEPGKICLKPKRVQVTF